MSHTISWYIPERVLLLELDDQLKVQEFEAINHEIVDRLDSSQQKVIVVIDVNKMQINHQTANHLRDTQKYMGHVQLNTALIITDNKLARLITLMAFSTSRTRLIQCKNLKEVEINLKQRGFESTSIASKPSQD